MPTEPDDKKPVADDQLASKPEPFKGVRRFVENNDVEGLMAELEKVPTDTAEAILNKLSISDGKGGRIELDRNNMVPMPDNIRKKAQEQIEKKHQQEQGDGT